MRSPRRYTKCDALLSQRAWHIPDRLVASGVLPAAPLRIDVAVLLHPRTDGVHRRLEPLAPQQVPDLARTQTRLLAPQLQDQAMTIVPPGVVGRCAVVARFSRTPRRSLLLAAPLVDRPLRAAVLLGCPGHPDVHGILEDDLSFGRRVPPT